MRQILFRGKRKDNGEWDIGHLTMFADYLAMIRPLTYMVEHKVIPETVGEFTGLTDSKGNKIFEGDIVSFWDGTIQECFDGDIVVETMPDKKFKKCPKQRREIVFNKGVFRLKNNHGIECFLDAETELEVIGNIHDDKKLLEGTE
ncbi:MAG: YopX family protein [Treponema sp.]|jgi:uncharacterized phage protein (TIGR01671 family)|nr:YopX family protein [Treponema sp.]